MGVFHRYLVHAYHVRSTVDIRDIVLQYCIEGTTVALMYVGRAMQIRCETFLRASVCIFHRINLPYSVQKVNIGR